MYKLVLFFTITLHTSILYAQGEKPIDIVVVGTYHDKSKNFNEDSIYSILNKFHPDIILLEVDSSSFTENFDLVTVYNANEFVGADKYKKENPKVLLRPFEFEKKKSYREDTLGITSGAGIIFNEIDRLYKLDSLSKSDKYNWERFISLVDSLDAIIREFPILINTPKTHNLIRERQFYQYYKVPEILDNIDFFLKLKIETKNMKGSITYREYYKRYAKFELLRNFTLAKNILKIVKANQGKKIIVLVGCFHKTEIIDILKWEEKNYNFKLKEYWE